MKHSRFCWLMMLGIALASICASATAQDRITIAAAADLHGAMDKLVDAYRQGRPEQHIDVVYGASGQLATQIEQGAPFDLFFSADSDYPQQLVAHGSASAKPVLYATGHLVLWSASIDMKQVQIGDLVQPRFGRIAIANPQHAPYGKRAEQALRAAGIWDQLQSRLVFGENISQTAQFAQSGNAQVGIIAESLALAAADKGTYSPVPASLYQPLRQSFVITRHGTDSALAKDFAQYVQTPAARELLAHYGFSLPDATSL